MNAKPDGGPAFPRKRSVHRADNITPPDNDQGFIHDPPQDGMSLRDWFAGMALQGFLASGDLDEDRLKKLGDGNRNTGLAVACYATADAMLAERSKVAS